jgi:disulfide bond formation protein DsbB
MMISLQKNLNGLLIVILSGVLLSAYGVQFIYHEQPCPLCMLQRLAMIAVACAAVINLCFGVRMSHYGLMLISSIFGGFVALRQISLHVCPGFSTFGFPVLGLSLYTWSFIVFVCVIGYVALLLFLYNPSEREELAPPLNGWCKFSCALILCITLANIVSTFFQCGWGPCVD